MAISTFFALNFMFLRYKSNMPFNTGLIIHPLKMSSEINYIDINKESWNNRTETHMRSEFYDLKGHRVGVSHQRHQDRNRNY